MQTFEKVLEIFRDYLDRDLEEEVLQCRRGYLRVTWNGDSPYCVDGVLCRTPEELFDLLLEDCLGFEEIQLTGGRRDPNRGDEAALEQLRQSYGKGAGFEVCNSRCDIWISENKIKSSGCWERDCSPAISCFTFALVRLYF